MATVSCISNLPGDLLVHYRPGQVPRPNHPVTGSIESLYDLCSNGIELYMPIRENGVFCNRRVESITKTLNPIKVLRCGRLDKKKVSLHPETLVLVNKPMFEFTVEREEGEFWLPVSHLKDGVSVLSACPPTASRVFNLSPFTVSKVKQEKLKNDLVTYSIRICSEHASVVTSSGLVLG